MALRLILAGEDLFAIEQQAREISQKFRRSVPDGRLIQLDSEARRPAMTEALLMTSLFAEKRLIFLNGVWANLTKPDQAWLSTQIAALVEDISVVLIEGMTAAKKQALPTWPSFQLKILPKATKASRQQWLKREIERRGLAGQLAEIWPQLIGIAETDPWLTTQELDKLAIAVRAKIPLGDLFSQTSEMKIYAVADALTAGQPARVLEFLQQSEASGHHPLELLGYLSSVAKNLLILVTEPGPVQLKVPPFVISRYRRLADRAGKRAVRQFFRRLVQLDLALKTGRQEGYAGLEQVILQFMTQVTV